MNPSTRKILFQVGSTISNDRDAIIDLLESYDIPVHPDSSDLQLADTFVDNIIENDDLKLGTAYILETKDSNFDGTIDKRNLEFIYDDLYDYYNTDDDYSNAGGLIAGAIGSVAGLGQSIIEGQNKKKYGAMDLAKKQTESRQAVIQGMMEQKRLQAQEKAKAEEKKKKQTRNIIIGVSTGVVLLATIGAIIYFKRRRNG